MGYNHSVEDPSSGYEMNLGKLMNLLTKEIEEAEDAIKNLKETEKEIQDIGHLIKKDGGTTRDPQEIMKDWSAAKNAVKHAEGEISDLAERLQLIESGMSEVESELEEDIYG